jgi:hypothetical protein
MDSDAVLFGSGNLVPNFEALFEANYQAQIVPVNPGDHIANPGAANETGYLIRRF